MTEQELYEGVREALSSLHDDSPRRLTSDSLDSCPGCQAQRMLDELFTRLIGTHPGTSVPADSGDQQKAGNKPEE